MSSLNPSQSGAQGQQWSGENNSARSKESDREEKLLKRKQANRLAAAKSKIKRRQDNEELAVQRQTLYVENQNLEARIREIQSHLWQLQHANSGLKQQYDNLVQARTS